MPKKEVELCYIHIYGVNIWAIFTPPNKHSWLALRVHKGSFTVIKVGGPSSWQLKWTHLRLNQTSVFLPTSCRELFGFGSIRPNKSRLIVVSQPYPPHLRPAIWTIIPWHTSTIFWSSQLHAYCVHDTLPTSRDASNLIQTLSVLLRSFSFLLN